MATLFTDLIKNASIRSNIKTQIAEATQWLKDTAMSFFSESNYRSDLRSNIEIGKMYMFSYSPKYKNSLPYYDRYPLVFPIERYSDGFLGMNLHYLPPMYRATLLNALYDTLNNDKFDNSTRLRVSYSILNRSSKFGYFKPCVKRYLYTHLNSRFKEISSNEWNKAVLLPTQKFEKASDSRVYKDSLGKV